MEDTGKLTREPYKVLKPMIQSGHWHLLEEVLKERKETLIQLLLKCGTDELIGIQGAIHELDTLLGMKSRLIAEENPKRPPSSF